ncbi:organellar oligopeptidase A, chloroplastic/mitochondrial-like isoform X2 [Phalaenopsis equestris]|uniref:organellar oligopeptidase A, chloroplastic/mitochondrial-like isoform X2 n=1 Tax=Phalaenopsis equestris TaxID=78828 RepID=UPI0009E1A796|nr:organellar oligopeptidase A, chloroplastic/mitochondrial-like isoform X2 [Phalaenopsis equestris]
MNRSSLAIISVTMLMASFVSLSCSAPLLRSATQIPRLSKTLPKTFSCPLWSSSFSFCLHRPTKHTVSLISAGFCTVPSSKMTSSVDDSLDSNPLLGDFDFPPFDIVEAKHVQPGIRELLRRLEGDLVELERTVEPTWPKLVEPLERILDRLQVVWGIVNHLKSVKDSSELRSAIDEVQPDKVKFQLRLGQSKPIYNAFKAIQDSASWSSLSDAHKRIVEAQVKEAVLNGVALEDQLREKFNEIEQELEKLSQKFSENVLDATKKFEKLMTDINELEGLPATALGLFAQTARTKGHENASAESGPWIITLDYPSFSAVLQHAQNRTLREEVYRAHISRASQGDLDNTPIIDQILKLRLEKAKLLGYNNFAEVSMSMKMATVQSAENLIEKLRNASWDPAVKDMEDVKKFAAEKGAAEANDLSHWDVSFWSERLRESKFDINEEELRPYFSLPKVMDGLFNLANKLFEIKIEPADGFAPVWQPDVRFYCVKDASANPIAYFYFDPYSRPSEKRGGAWMDEVFSRSTVLARDGSKVRLPVAHMVCNQIPPVGGKPSLMTFREVETVFHEFGHALQHMLTKQDEGLVAGIRGIEWDAVELPSQFMENWCYQRDTLLSIAKHYETGESLPEEVYQKLLAAKTFRAGSLSLRQWAEVLSADAFSAFEDAGLDDDKAIKETGQRFRDTILALGGGKPPLEVFVEFRGREPSPEALLRHNGLLPVAA